MPSIDLMPTSAAFSAFVGWNGSGESELRYTVRAALAKRVRLSSGEEFGALPGRVTLSTRRDSSLGEHAAGDIVYYEAVVDYPFREPAHFIATLHISQRQFDELLLLTRKGCLPTEISLMFENEPAKGIAYGDDPHGRDAVWNNREFPRLLINSANLLASLKPAEESV